MTIHVQLFARARDLAGSDILTIDMRPDSSVAELRRRIVEACPALAGFLDRCAIALNEDFADDRAVVKPGATAAVIPPVSGGAVAACGLALETNP